MTQRLPIPVIQNEIHALDGWELSFENDRSSLKKSFQFSDFKNAWAFMSACAIIAEEMNHHPEWFNVYNRVDITLSTHDADGVTQLDLDLASKMNKLAQL